MTDHISGIEEDFERIRTALRRLNPEFHKVDSAWPATDRIEAELTRLREENEAHKEEVKRLASAAIENARLRDQIDALSSRPDWTAYNDLQDERDRLREALDRAGTRLAQVQPAIDPACGWALDIVPQAEQEIADALTGGDAEANSPR